MRSRKVKEYLDLHAARELSLCCVNDAGLMGGANGPLECALSLFAGLASTCIQVQILPKIMVN